eukprot:Skav230825  [mRNA]  locus=scaffold851:504664:505080:+ [translate_table: standard]
MVSPRSDVSDDGAHHFSLDGLASEWDDIGLVRERLRDQQQLCRHWDPTQKKEVDAYPERNVPDLKCNQLIISPVLKFMAKNGRKVPSIDRVIEQVTLLFQKAKCPASGDRYYQEGWSVRRLCSYLKRFAFKKGYKVKE